MPGVPEVIEGDLNENQTSPQRTDTFDPTARAICPVERSAADEVRRHAYFGAPALQVVSVRSVAPLPLPILTPACFPVGQTAFEHERARNNLHGNRYVATALQSFVGYSDEQRERLGELLTHGPIRHDGLPGWNPNVSDLGPTQWLEQPKKGLIGRAVLTAVYSDLEGLPVRRVLHAADVPRRARDHRARGRLVLHRLGVWPWALEQDGALPRRWDGRSSAWYRADWFREPLEEWASQARAELEHQLGREGSTDL